jgi:hypothetical protein
MALNYPNRGLKVSKKFVLLQEKRYFERLSPCRIASSCPKLRSYRGAIGHSDILSSLFIRFPVLPLGLPAQILLPQLLSFVHSYWIFISNVSFGLLVKMQEMGQLRVPLSVRNILYYKSTRNPQVSGDSISPATNFFYNNNNHRLH